MIKRLSIMLLLIGCPKAKKPIQTTSIEAPKTTDYSWLGMCRGKAGTNLVICNPPLAPAPQVCTFASQTGIITCSLPTTVTNPPTNLSVISVQ